METVFSTDDLPKRRLTVKMTLTDRFASNTGRAVMVMREKIAREIAEKCIECDDVVKIAPNGPFLEVRADCIIVTADELADLMRKQFRAGLEHAQHFMPVYANAAAQQDSAQVAGKDGAA